MQENIPEDSREVLFCFTRDSHAGVLCLCRSPQKTLLERYVQAHGPGSPSKGQANRERKQCGVWQERQGENTLTWQRAFSAGSHQPA